MIEIYVLAGVLLVLGAVLKSPWFKGWLGELQVNLAAKVFLSKQDYHLIRNVTIPTEDGTTQIDHIIVSKFGVFVVETKNLRGWIYGSERDSMWTQKIFKASHQFQNPLRQNYKHTKILGELLDLPASQIKSVIVFVGDSTFKTPMPQNVTETGGYIRYIKRHRDEIFAESEVAAIISRIAEMRLAPTFHTHRQHVRHVRELVASKEKRDAVLNNSHGHQAGTANPAGSGGPTPTCPQCGQPMILRIRKKGAQPGEKFWGCQGFPQCRGIRPLNEG